MKVKELIKDRVLLISYNDEDCSEYYYADDYYHIKLQKTLNALVDKITEISERVSRLEEK